MEVSTLVLVSQVWIQHLPCTQIIGYSYLRVGSDIDPDLALPLYTALVTAMTELQKEEEAGDNFILSGVYGYSLHKEGLGLYSIQSEKVRVVMLCEGYTGQGIPYLSGDALTKVTKLLDHLNVVITEEGCRSAHSGEFRDESFWFNLVISCGLGQQIHDSITKVYPLRDIRMEFSPGRDNEFYIRTLEDTQQSLGPGWAELDAMITKKIQLIYQRPYENFQVYRSLFQQISEFKPDSLPNSLLLTFDKGNLSDISSTLAIFLSISEDELKLQFGLPLVPSLYLEGSRDVYSAFQGMIL